MFFRQVKLRCFFLCVSIWSLTFVFPDIMVYAEEKIKNFYLSNYKDDGSQDWEVKGEEAVIRGDKVDINEMDAKYYSEKDTLSVKSQKATLDKGSMDVQLKDDVKVENKDGIKLTTDSLNWKKSENRLETKDWVQIDNKDMQIKAKGLGADTQLKTADFEEDVKVKLPTGEGQDFIVITCVGPLEIDYNSGNAVFNKNVVVESKDGTLFSDKATVFFDSVAKIIKKIVSEGNVKIVRDDNVIVARKAIYFADEKKIVLEGKPRVIYFPKKGEEMDVSNVK